MKLLSMIAVLGLVSITVAAPEKRCQVECGSNAYCDLNQEYPSCVCVSGYYGSGYSGCTDTPQCRVHDDCKDNEICETNLCQSPCFRSCPQDVGCQVKNHKATCIYSTEGILSHPLIPPRHLHQD